MRNAIRSYAVLLLAAVALAACASVPAPRNLEQSVAYGYGVTASARNTAANLLDRRRITVAQAKDVQSKADLVRGGLDLARTALAAGDSITAQRSFDGVAGVLQDLESFVAAWEGK